MEETDQQPSAESNSTPQEVDKPVENDQPVAEESQENTPEETQHEPESSEAIASNVVNENEVEKSTTDSPQIDDEESPSKPVTDNVEQEKENPIATEDESAHKPAAVENQLETESPKDDANTIQTDTTSERPPNEDDSTKIEAEFANEVARPEGMSNTISETTENIIPPEPQGEDTGEKLKDTAQPNPTPAEDEQPNADVQVQEEKLEEITGVKPADTETDESPATVKFQIVPSSEVITVTSTLGTNIANLKDVAAAQVQVLSSEILIRRNGEELNMESSLLDLGVAPNSTVQFEILAAKEDISLKSITSLKEAGSSDFITVRVQKDNNEVSDIVVQIERQYTRKAFLGGYRHKLSGYEYHHASVQTQQKVAKPSAVEKFNRDCQTVFERNRSQQTTNVTSTQMPKTGCYISTEEDKILSAKNYVTYEEFMKKRIKAVIVLQSYLRRWQARHLVNELRDDRDRRMEWERLEEIRKRREREERIKTELEKRINPKTRGDFDLLYAALEKWRLEELGHINDEFTGPERKAALCALLEQETQLIGSIDRRRIDASKDGKEKKIMHFLNKAAAPKRWRAYDGRFTEMDTQYTIRAKELRDIYNSINMKYLTQDERLDVLLTLKHTVKEHDCKLTREITELIDREADLLMRGMRDSNLEGLRKRIATLFLQYCKNPLFNPEAARLLKVPEDPSTLVKDIYFCPSSNQYLPSTEFKLTSKSRVVGKCRKVLQLDNEARTRQDYSHYRVMMRSLRRSEENYHDNSKIAYLIQEKDLQYLIENIWAAQSILSSWDDLYDLILVRWNKDDEWSPWNTILLTKDEAMAHLKLDHLDDAYSKQFISKISHKHTLARVHFAKLPGMAEALRKKTTGSKKMPGVGAIEGVSAY